MIKDLTEEIREKKPSNILQLVVSINYQERLATRITDFVDNDETILEALRLLQLLSKEQITIISQRIA